MTIQNFAALETMLTQKLAGRPTPVIAIAGAADPDIVQLAKDLSDAGLARSILVGEESIPQYCRDIEFKPQDILYAATPPDIAAAACGLLTSGRADILMKGTVNSSIFLRAVLHPEQGPRNKNILSHLAVFEIPGENRLHFYTDGGMCVSPDLKDKRMILENAVNALHNLGYDCPKVAVLAANEKVSEKIPASMDAAALQQMNRDGEITGCLVEGPITMDVAWSREAARKKGIESQISGAADLFLVPDIQAGNMVGKALMYGAKARMAGVILGAAYPIVMVSRADDGSAKRSALALALACMD